MRHNTRSKIKILLGVGIPIAIQMTLEGGAFAVTGVIMGVFGDKVLAANQITIIIGNLSFLVISAISASTTIKISHFYGNKDYAEVIKISAISYKIIIVINVITIIVLYSSKEILAKVFTEDAEVIKIVAGFIGYVCLYQIPDGIQNISIGILRGLQDVRIIPIVAFISYFAINIPMGCVMAFYMEMDFNGLWYGFILGLSLSAIYFSYRAKKDIIWYQKK